MLHGVPSIVRNAYLANSAAGKFRDLTRPAFGDFEEAIAQLAACKVGKSIDQTRLKEVKNTVLGDSDFGETYDLSIDQQGGFWDKIIAQTESLQHVQAIPTTYHIIPSNEITLGSDGEDVFSPGVEGTDPTREGTIDTAQRTFKPEEVVGVFGLTDTVLEDNIERGSLRDHIMTMFEAAAANEWAKAIYNGTMVGTTNSDRGKITGCFDGFIQQANGGGNILYSTAYEDRYVSSIQENDKFLAASKLLPSKYGNGGGFAWLTARGILQDWNAELAQRQTVGGDNWIQGGYWLGNNAQGFPLYHVPALRTDYLVKGTGTVGATTPVDTYITAIAKGRATTLTAASISNAGTAQIMALGCDAAGTSFDLNAEKVVQSGTASGSTFTLAAALARDHAINEILTEYSTAPTVTGVPCLLTAWSNLAVYYQRVMRIEPYRLPRERKTWFVMTARFVPVMRNPDASVLIRDLEIR